MVHTHFYMFHPQLFLGKKEKMTLHSQKPYEKVVLPDTPRINIKNIQNMSRIFRKFKEI